MSWKTAGLPKRRKSAVRIFVRVFSGGFKVDDRSVHETTKRPALGQGLGVSVALVVVERRKRGGQDEPL